MRGAIAVMLVMLGGCMMDTREPMEPECVGGSPDCGDPESSGPWCVRDRAPTITAPHCEGEVVVCGEGEPTCDPSDIDL